MKEILLLFLLPQVVFIPLAVIVKRAMNRAEKALEPETTDAGGDAPPEGDGDGEKERGAGVYLALWSAYKSLTDQRAHRYRGWLSSCIRHAQRGEMIPAAVAVKALELTRSELAGARFDDGEHEPIYFDLSGLDAAIAALAKLTEKEEGEGV